MADKMLAAGQHAHQQGRDIKAGQGHQIAKAPHAWIDLQQIGRGVLGRTFQLDGGKAMPGAGGLEEIRGPLPAGE